MNTKKHRKGVKIKLQFSKSGDKKIEEYYATHYIDNKKNIKLKVIKAREIQQLPGNIDLPTV